MKFCRVEGSVFALPLLIACLLVGCEVKTSSTMSGAGGSTSSTSTTGSHAGKSASSASTGSEGKPSETITAEGSSTVYPICQAFAVEFEKTSHHKVSVGRQGTGGGYKRFVIRQADIWNASRPIDTKEVDELKAKGIEWVELNIAVDGIVIAVNPQNKWCSEMTCAQLKRIWEPDSKVRTWSDIDPTWPAEEIVLYGADTDSGTFEYFTEVINDKKKAINIRYTPSADDNILVQGIASNKYALGFIPYGYYVESTDRLKPLSISPTKEPGNAAPAVAPTEDSILSGEYAPLARPLFMIVNRDSLKRKEVADFLRFAVSETAQPLVSKRGFVRVKDEVLKTMQKKLEDYLTELSVSSK